MGAAAFKDDEPVNFDDPNGEIFFPFSHFTLEGDSVEDLFFKACFQIAQPLASIEDPEGFPDELTERFAELLNGALERANKELS